MINEKNNKDERCAITKMIVDYHVSGQKIPKIVQDNIDFDEIFLKDIYFESDGRTMPFTVKENIFINLIKNAPIDSYKEFITLDWVDEKTIDKSLTIKPIYTAIKNKKYDFIFQTLELVDKSEINNRKTIEYSKTLFQPIFNMEEYLNSHDNFLSTKQDVAQYYDLFKAAFKRYPRFHNIIYSSKPVVEYGWHLFDRNTASIFGRTDKINISLSMNPNYFEIYKDVLTQYKEIGFEGCSLVSLNNIVRALNNFNFEAIEYLHKEKIISNEILGEAFDIFIKENIDLLNKDYDDGNLMSLKHVSDGFNKIASYYINNKIDFNTDDTFKSFVVIFGNNSLKEKYLKNIGFIDFNLNKINAQELLMLRDAIGYFSDKKAISKKYPEFKMEFILGFNDENNKEKKMLERKKIERKEHPNILYLWMNKIHEANIFMNLDNTYLDKTRLKSLIAKNQESLFGKNIPAKDLDILLNRYYLEIGLDEKEGTTKRLKI